MNEVSLYVPEEDENKLTVKKMLPLNEHNKRSRI